MCLFHDDSAPTSTSRKISRNTQSCEEQFINSRSSVAHLIVSKGEESPTSHASSWGGVSVSTTSLLNDDKITCVVTNHLLAAFLWNVTCTPFLTAAYASRLCFSLPSKERTNVFASRAVPRGTVPPNALSLCSMRIPIAILSRSHAAALRQAHSVVIRGKCQYFASNLHIRASFHISYRRRLLLHLMSCLFLQRDIEIERHEAQLKIALPQSVRRNSKEPIAAAGKS